MASGLRRLRQSQGWSQRELALAAGLNERTVQRLEAGSAASLETRRALAAAFDMPLANLAAALDNARPRRGGSVERIPPAWRPLAQHAAAFVLGLTIVSAVAHVLGVTGRLPLGAGMIWAAVLLIWLAWRLHRTNPGKP